MINDNTIIIIIILLMAKYCMAGQLIYNTILMSCDAIYCAIHYYSK